MEKQQSSSKKRKRQSDFKKGKGKKSYAHYATFTDDATNNDNNNNNDGTNLLSRGEGKNGNIVHPGSYACRDYRALMGVQLPKLEKELKEIEQSQVQEQLLQQTLKTNDDTHNGEGQAKGTQNTTVVINKQQDLQEERQQGQSTGDPSRDTQQSLDETSVVSEKGEKGDSESRKKRVKRKYAFLLGYLGTKYSGFQINPGDNRTLQAEIELAMYRQNFLTARNFGYPFKYGWSTSGRTDKGVHACAQVVSAKLEVLPEQEKDTNLIVNALNEVLPHDIRVLDANRVVQKFCAHTARARVRYQYMIPSFVLTDVKTIRDMFTKAGCLDGEREAADPLKQEEMTLLQSQLKDYRVTPQKLDLLKKALKAYEGTHSFHNYSKGVKNDEARSSRYIVSFDVEEPIIFENGTQWIPTRVLGQSFLLHQIRKMICMAIDVAREAAPLQTLVDGLSREECIRVAPAPAQGLYLEMSFYDGYNKRKQRSNPDLPDLEWHIPGLDNNCSTAYNRWHSFRNGVLMPHLVEEEDREGNFVKWMYQQEFLNEYRSHYKLLPEGESSEKQTSDE